MDTSRTPSERLFNLRPVSTGYEFWNFKLLLNFYQIILSPFERVLSVCKSPHQISLIPHQISPTQHRLNSTPHREGLSPKQFSLSPHGISLSFHQIVFSSHGISTNYRESNYLLLHQINLSPQQTSIPSNYNAKVTKCVLYQHNWQLLVQSEQ